MFSRVPLTPLSYKAPGDVAVAALRGTRNSAVTDLVLFLEAGMVYASAPRYAPETAPTRTRQHEMSEIREGPANGNATV